MEAINSADAKSRFPELISRTAAGERFLIKRRERSVAVLISPDELERLERASHIAHRLAVALGQDKDLLEKVEQQTVHPVMAAFGLWKDEADLADLAEEIKLDLQIASIAIEHESLLITHNWGHFARLVDLAGLTVEDWL